MTDVTFVYFWVAGEISVVTRMIGIKPNQTMLAGRLLSAPPTTLCPADAWRLYSPHDLSAHLNEHLESLLKLLNANAVGVREAVSNFQCGIICVVWHDGFEQHFYLSRNIVQSLADFGLSVDLESYEHDVTDC